MYRLTISTRETDIQAYPFGLASAVHFQLEKDGETTFLNHHYGILFAEGDISKENTIIPLGIENPTIFHAKDGEIGIAGKRILDFGRCHEADGNMLWAWKTKDLIHFETLGLVDASYVLDREIGKTMEVDDILAHAAIHFWNPPEDEDNPTVTKYSFPLAKGYGDPVIFKWCEKWYYVSTNDNLDDIGIYAREADSVMGLFEPNIMEHLILPYDETRELIQTFWAPEFHVIGGKLYLLFAVSGKTWGPQCHLMKLKEGGSIIDPESWEDPVRVVRMDGSPLAKNAITLDMTYLKSSKGSYMVWSYRENIGTPLDTGSMLYIAAIDEKEPWKLISEPLLLSRPLYGWENVEGTINNEGPNAFVRNDRIYLTYSGGAANGYTYAVGLLSADLDADLLDMRSWAKYHTPILSYYLVDEFGPGHNSFFEDEYGNLMIAYHGETEIHEHLRCNMIRRVCFKEDGTPYIV